MHHESLSDHLLGVLLVILQILHLYDIVQHQGEAVLFLQVSNQC